MTADETTEAAAPPHKNPALSSIQCVAVVGLGLLGGSLGLCLRKRWPGVRVVGYARRDETVHEAVNRGIVADGSTDPEHILPQADLSIICIPVTAIIAFAREHASRWRKGAIVTDVGSVKGPIVSALQPELEPRGVHFVGSHPMAGSERSGIAHAAADLYENAVTFVTAGKATDTKALDAVQALWELTGAHACLVDEARHDALVARTSHLPHLLAALAVSVALREKNAAQATGAGFHDFTRIASGEPGMWQQIFEMNRDEMLTAIDEFRQELDEARKIIADGHREDLGAVLTHAHDERARWLENWKQQQGPQT